MSKLEDEIFRLGDFINSSGQAYSQAEDSISKLVGLDNLTINSSISSNENSNSPTGNYPFKGFDFSSSIKHLLDFFSRIGQATIDFFVLDDPRNALKAADSFIDMKPCTGIAYRAGLPSYKNILIDTDFNIAGNSPLINKYEGKYTAVDKTDFESVFSNIWNNIWSHIKKIGEFFAPVYENMKDLSIKHQEAMKELPNDIAILDYEPWMSTLKTFSDPEDKYRCAISNIPSYKEAGHAMVLGWMATDPSSRGINPKYYPQLLATLMVYKDKGALTLEQIDAKYLEIYNHNEEAIKRAEEKEKEENSSVLDTAMEWTHSVLDIVGWVPFCGDVCDLINAGLYLLQNDFVNVALSCIAFIPAIGQGIKGILKKIFSAGDDAKAIAKILSKIDNPKAIIEKIKGACTHIISWLKNLPNSIDNLLDSPFISKMLGGAKKGVSKIIDGISSMLDKFTTKIQDMVNWIEKKLGKQVKKTFRTATEKDVDVINDLRTKYHAGKKRNVATGKGWIGDNEINLESISGTFTDNNYINKGNFKPPQPDNYHYKGPIPEYTNHTEQKIIEHLKETYKNTPNIKGKIEIISERPFCDNCTDIVDQFQKEFPNIEVVRVEVIK
ncbi:deaminase domain-containing protein [Vallitalea sediminicola]